MPLQNFSRTPFLHSSSFLSQVLYSHWILPSRMGVETKMGMRLLVSFVVIFALLNSVAPQPAINSSDRDRWLPSNEVPNTKEWCRHGWEINPNLTKCYKHISKLLRWNESESHCNTFGGHLAAVVSSEDVIFAQKLCEARGDGCWIGTNESLIGSNITHSCSLLINRTNIVGDRCDAVHRFICMLDTGRKCFNMRCHKEYLIILSVVSGLIICATLIVVIWLLNHKRSKKSRKSHNFSTTSSSSLISSRKVFTKEELKSVTKNFSDSNRLLGDAKTGGTYSGTLGDGSRVAVKRLRRSSFQKKEEFYSDIGRVARLNHPNLVAIKGWCYDHGERFIVYEFVGNGLLERWLHNVPKGARSLDWGTRMKIATTVAQGIEFLHDKVKPQVVHRDIRASNVLLDEEFGAHLMGVGLSKLVPWEVMEERTVMAGGTHGYLAPEYVYKNEMTTKSDVYSFGVLLLEIVSGRRAAQAVETPLNGRQSIFEWATPLVQAHCYLHLLDPNICATSSIPEAGEVQKVVDLVYSCTQHVPSMRPKMTHVVHLLQHLL